MFFLCRW